MRSGYFVERPRRGLLQSERVFSSRASLFVSPCGVVLMSCKVNFDVIRSALQNSMCLLRGCLHDTGATFAPERLHSASLSWLYICLHDTATKCHAGASHPGVSSPRCCTEARLSLRYEISERYHVNAKRPQVSV